MPKCLCVDILQEWLLAEATESNIAEAKQIKYTPKACVQSAKYASFFC
jgi:hypothetical protein